jgi:hypothetical protein
MESKAATAYAAAGDIAQQSLQQVGCAAFQNNWPCVVHATAVFVQQAAAVL